MPGTLRAASQFEQAGCVRRSEWCIITCNAKELPIIIIETVALKSTLGSASLNEQYVSVLNNVVLAFCHDLALGLD